VRSTSTCTSTSGLKNTDTTTRTLFLSTKATSTCTVVTVGHAAIIATIQTVLLGIYYSVCIDRILLLLLKTEIGQKKTTNTMGFFGNKSGVTAQTGLANDDPELAVKANYQAANDSTNAQAIATTGSNSKSNTNERPNMNGKKSNSIFRDLDPSNGKVMPQLNEQEQRAYNTIKRLQYIMDDCIKLPNIFGFKDYTIGIDPIIGLIPGFGDFGSAMISLAIVARCAPVLSRYTVLRMLVNVWIDAVIGTIPIIGDIFDMGWKANTRNVAIFEDHMKNGLQSRHNTDRRWVIMICLTFFCICTFSIAMVAAFVIALIIIL
jgi:Domain of unknown function (DUF4112)